MSSAKKLAQATKEYIKHLANDGRDFYAQALAASDMDTLLSGLMVAAPTSASTQATGASGNTVWRVNVDKGLFQMGSKVYELAAQVDVLVANGNVGLINGNSMVAAVVVYLNSGVATVATVRGASAVTGSQVAPTDTAITTALSTSNWLRLAHITINRTADTTVTQSQDNTLGDRGLCL